jgi:hypothetical protein
MLGGDLAHAVSLEFEVVGVANLAIADGVGDSRVGNN